MGLWPSVLGFAGGIAGAIVASFLSKHPLLGGASRSGPLALGVAAAGLVTLVKQPDLEPAQLGLVLGLALGAWLLAPSDESTPDWPSSAAFFGAAILAADILGRRAVGGHSSHAGLVLAIASVAVLAAVLFAGAKDEDSSAALKGWKGLIFIALLIGAGWVIATRYIWLGNAWCIFGGAVLVALVASHLTGRESERSTLRFALSCAVWLGVATLAFAYLRGFGMSLALLAGAVYFLSTGNRAGLLSLAPLAALVAYRVFREAHVTASRALDIGQHYGLVGLLAGATLTIVAWEYRRSLFGVSPAKAGLAKVLVVAVALGAPVLGAVLLAEKGYVGLLVGLVFGAAVLGLQGARSPLGLAMPTGLALGMSSIFGWMVPFLEKTRDEKLKALYWSVPVIVLVAFLLVWLPTQTSKRPEGSSQ